MPDVTNPTPTPPTLVPHTSAASSVLNSWFGQIKATLDALATATNDLDEANLVLALQRKLGLNSGSQKGRQFVYNPNAGTRTSSTYGDLNDAPDVATGIYVPAGAKVRLGFHGLLDESGGVVGNARAAIFIGANQLNVWGPNMTAPQIQEGGLGALGSNGIFQPVFSFPLGLASSENAINNAGADVATGTAIAGVELGAGGANQINCYIGGTRYALSDGNSGIGAQKITYGGGVCEFFVDPANPVTVDIGVKYKMNSGGGTVSAKQRKLWVEVVGY